MRDNLTQYVNLLFAGAPDSDEIRQEILQNTLDRYDDLVSQGKSPEAAYRLAISGIGDINEILGTQPASAHDIPSVSTARADDEDPVRKKRRAGAIMLYILSAIPLIVLGELGAGTIGLVLTIIMVAAATYEMIITGRKDDDEDEDEKEESYSQTPQQELKNSFDKLVGAVGLAVYLIVSFMTGAWHITWIIFPIMACVKGLINAVIDLKEANRNES